MALKPVLFALVALTLLVSVVTDVRSRRIPDLVTLPAGLLALGLRLGLEGPGDAEHGLVSGLLGAAGCLGLFAIFALVKQGLGWGDVKLMGAVGAAFGFPLALSALVFVSLAGAAQALITMIWQGAVSDTLRGVLARWRKSSPPGAVPAPRRIPYGVAIALGSAWAMWWDSTTLYGR